MDIPHTIPADAPPMAAGRFAATIRRDRADGCTAALLGLPDDLGVSLNNGRTGAAEGPNAFRRALAAFGAPYDAARRRPLEVAVFDAGDVVPAPHDGDPEQQLAETHRRVLEAATALHARGLVVVGVGGGHDLTLPAVHALAAHLGEPVGGINVDAHLDVRETPGSGMPYRALIERGDLEPARFVEFGVGRFANSQAHTEWLLNRHARVITADEALTSESAADDAFANAFDMIGGGQGAGFVSIDLDAIDGAQAPGVSAVNPRGLSVRDAATIAEHAGRHRGVRYFDLMELNPAFDIDRRTARIAALLFLTFVAGLADRTG